MTEPLPEIPDVKDYDPETGVGDPSTPLSAAWLNPWKDAIEAFGAAVVSRAETAAEDAEALAASTTDSIIAGALSNASSATRTTADALYATASAVNSKAPQNLTGTYAARPAATSVPAGTIYYATDVPEAYRSNGSTWTVVGAGGNELGYAQSTTPFSTTSTTAVDVTGVTTTFVVGERPILIMVDGQVANSTATGITYLSIALDGVEKGREQSVGITSNVWHGLGVRARVSGLTPGTSHTAKVRLCTNSGTAQAGGENSTSPLSIQVVTL